MLLTLMVFGSFNLAAKSIYFSCDTLRLDVLGDPYESYTYTKYERVKSLEMNQQEDRVVWGTNTSTFIPDGNRDNIYEMEFKTRFESISLRFNQITKRLDESIRSVADDTYLKYKYQCEVVEPLFK